MSEAHVQARRPESPHTCGLILCLSLPSQGPKLLSSTLHSPHSTPAPLASRPRVLIQLLWHLHPAQGHWPLPLLLANTDPMGLLF